MKHLYKILILLLSFPFFYGCLDDPEGPEGIMNARIPELKIDTITDKTAISFKIQAAISEKNGAPVFRYGFIYKEQGSQTEETIEVGVDNKTTTFSHVIASLKENTKYEIRAFAENIKGIGVSEIYLITTENGLGTVSTVDPEESEIGATKAKITGKIVDPGEGEIIERGVFYSEQEDMSEKKKVSATGSGDLFTVELRDLKPSTQYYVKVYVENAFGVFEGTTKTFFTTSGKPTLAEFKPGSVKTDFNLVRFTAEVLETGDSPITEWGFCWTQEETEDLNKTDHEIIQVEVTHDGKGVFVGELTEKLEDHTRYYVRAYAENSFGITYSEIIPFYPKTLVPTVSIEVEEPDAGFVTLRMRLESSGSSWVSAMGILYSTDESTLDLEGDCEILEYPDGGIHAGDEFEQTIKVAGGKTYYVRAYAVNEAGTEYGTIVSFTTPPLFITKPSLPVKASYMTSFTSGDYAYLLGGFGSNEFYGYNAQSNSWSRYGAFPLPIRGTTVASLDDSSFFFAMGGMDEDNTILETTYIYDNSRHYWSKMTDAGDQLPEPLFDAVSFAENNVIYVIGGRNTYSSYSKQIYSYRFGGTEWHTIGTINGTISQGVVFKYDGKIYIGLGDNDPKLWWSTAGSDMTNWTGVSNLSIPSDMEAVSTGVVYEDSFFGIDKKGRIWEYELQENKWYQRGVLSGISGRPAFHMFLLNGEIYILGQSDNWSSFVTYDPIWDPVREER